MCSAISSSRHAAASASISARGQTLPPELLCVFSIATMLVVGVCPRSPERAFSRTCSGVKRPLGEEIGRAISPAKTAGPPSSERRMCESSSAINSSPGSPRTRNAISLAMVAVGTKTASSCARISAIRDSRSLTVGSSRICSSPTSAAAIAARMPAVGRVAVSDRRSITLVLCLRSRPREARIPLGEEHQVPVGLLLVAEAVDAQVAHPLWHTPDERCRRTSRGTRRSPAPG